MCDHASYRAKFGDLPGSVSPPTAKGVEEPYLGVDVYPTVPMAPRKAQRPLAVSTKIRPITIDLTEDTVDETSIEEEPNSDDIDFIAEDDGSEEERIISKWVSPYKLEALWADERVDVLTFRFDEKRFRECGKDEMGKWWKVEYFKC